MRETKFRAWLTDRREMVNLSDGGEVSLEFNRHGLVALYIGKYEQTFLLMVNLSDGGEVSLEFNRHGLVALYIGKYEQTFLLSEFELIQYTGLKDKNGVEIYEGDILRNPRYNWPGALEIIEFEDNLQDADGNFMAAGWAISGYTDEYELIGNIYENPELLK